MPRLSTSNWLVKATTVLPIIDIVLIDQMDFCRLLSPRDCSINTSSNRGDYRESQMLHFLEVQEVSQLSISFLN